MELVKDLNVPSCSVLSFCLTSWVPLLVNKQLACCPSHLEIQKISFHRSKRLSRLPFDLTTLGMHKRDGPCPFSLGLSQRCVGC